MKVRGDVGTVNAGTGAGAPPGPISSMLAAGSFVEAGWARCRERAIEPPRCGGLGHSLGIHGQDPDVIDGFIEEKPAFRIVVDSNVATGVAGYTNGLAPTMTLGRGIVGQEHHVGRRHADASDIKHPGAEIRPSTRARRWARTLERDPPPSARGRARSLGVLDR